MIHRQTYQQLSRNKAQFQSQTGISLAIFDQFFPYFASAWDEHNNHFTTMQKERIRPSRSYKNNVFEDTESMLVFILFYIKTNSLQETQAAMFGMNQPQANKWIHLLKQILMTALKHSESLPCRDFDSLQKHLHQGQDLLLDGNERPIPRPADEDVQKEYYSGKKNAYR
jgi:hypothetical protein